LFEIVFERRHFYLVLLVVYDLLTFANYYSVLVCFVSCLFFYEKAIVSLKFWTDPHSLRNCIDLQVFRLNVISSQLVCCLF